MTKKVTKEENELLIKVEELTADLQRTRADFENYRKRVDDEKSAARESGRLSAVAKMLPVIDDIDRAVAHLPAHLAEDDWARGIATLAKNLDKSLETVGVRRINAESGTPFDPDLHNAIQFDEDSEGDNEIIAEELQPGYTLDGTVLRPAMVKVTRQ